MDVQFSWLLVIKIDGGVYRREAVNLCNGKSKFFVNLVGGRLTSINELDSPEHVMSNDISVLSYFHWDVYRREQLNICTGKSKYFPICKLCRRKTIRSINELDIP
ncbi:uncharacterized protein [Primulina huaijiensis]|uniref:uncharacterized protein isoform X2 n=1 Tax=Primulina huaijiensis TaxID=1492673 RepID=UPI003CC73A35